MDQVAKHCLAPFGTAPTVIRGALAAPEEFFGEAQIEEFINNDELASRAGIFYDQQWLTLDEHPEAYTPEGLRKHRHAPGATFMLRGLQRVPGPVRDACLHIHKKGGEAWATVQAVATETPPNNQGLAVHWDITPVAVMQIRGAKTWYVFDPVVSADELTTVWAERGFTDEEQSRLQPENAVFTATLEPGDIIVTPAGSPHFCVGGDEGSLHVSIGPLPHLVAKKYANEDHAL